jgi:hypothetical protein
MRFIAAALQRWGDQGEPGLDAGVEPANKGRRKRRRDDRFLHARPLSARGMYRSEDHQNLWVTNKRNRTAAILGAVVRLRVTTRKIVALPRPSCLLGLTLAPLVASDNSARLCVFGKWAWETFLCVCGSLRCFGSEVASYLLAWQWLAGAFPRFVPLSLYFMGPLNIYSNACMYSHYYL